MQKYLKITGLTFGDNTECLVPVYCVAQFITEPTTLDRVLLRNFSSTSATDIVAIFHDATTTAKNIEMCNFVVDLMVKAQQQKYTNPYIEIAAVDFPVRVTNVTVS